MIVIFELKTKKKNIKKKIIKYLRNKLKTYSRISIAKLKTNELYIYKTNKK